jgi:transposase InsO family protein
MICALANHHKRYGVGMIYLKLRQGGQMVNYDRVEACTRRRTCRCAGANGKPNQNAYIESFNGKFRDECLNEHGFSSLLHARTEIENWQREYNEERPKKALSGLTPAAYAKQLH